MVKKTKDVHNGGQTRMSSNHTVPVEYEYRGNGDVDEKGHWRPAYPSFYAPIFEWPPHLGRILTWLFGWGGFIWPANIIYVGLAFFAFRYLQPGLAAYETLSFLPIIVIVLRNLALTFIVYGSYHLLLYRFKLQGRKQKYHPAWQQTSSKKFLFGNQTLDNMFYTCVSGVTIWSAYEIGYFWGAANGYFRLLTFSESPLWFIGLFFLIPFVRETHFYFIHRIIHWPPLLRAVHSVHHRNPNPGPWSGMSMHPVEHLLYFSFVFLFLLVPAHPVHVLFATLLAGLTPAKGHSGFEAPVLGVWPESDYFHYLHHKHVSCNFGTGLVPWDKWLGRFHDGKGPYKTSRPKK